MSKEKKQRLKEYQKNHGFNTFSGKISKMEPKALIFDRKCINENMFHRCE